MAEIWIISDPHFGHANMLNFKSADGVPMRVFNSVEEMDECMVSRWNEVVRPQDHVYCLGDVAMRRESLKTVERLNGHKRLVFGNHDIYDYKSYTEVGFKKLYGLRVMDNILFSHIPVHPGSLGRFLGNAHGHVHANRSPEGLYLNVCVEVTDYRPVPLYEVKRKLEASKAKGDENDYALPRMHSEVPGEAQG